MHRQIIRRAWWKSALVKSFVRPSVFILGTLVLALAIYAVVMKGPATAIEGVKSGLLLFAEIFPNLILGFLLAGLAQMLVPRDFVVKYAGENSGVTGYLLATGIGACTPGGPFFQFPLVAALWKAGAGVGQITSYLTAWALLGFQRILIYEGPMMGWRYTSSRVLASLIAPPLMGFLTSWIFRTLHSAGPS
jgi:uncharacterized membrane protein YraQ (UPF0718 family)